MNARRPSVLALVELIERGDLVDELAAAFRETDHGLIGKGGPVWDLKDALDEAERRPLLGAGR